MLLHTLIFLNYHLCSFTSYTAHNSTVCGPTTVLCVPCGNQHSNNSTVCAVWQSTQPQQYCVCRVAINTATTVLCVPCGNQHRHNSTVCAVWQSTRPTTVLCVPCGNQHSIAFSNVRRHSAVETEVCHNTSEQLD